MIHDICLGAIAKDPFIYLLFSLFYRKNTLRALQEHIVTRNTGISNIVGVLKNIDFIPEKFHYEPAPNERVCTRSPSMDDEPADAFARTRKRASGFSVSKLLNFLGYVSAPLFAFENGVLIFGPWEFDTPEKQSGILSFYLMSVLAFIGLQVLLALFTTTGRNMTKEHVLLMDVAVSATLFIVPVVAIALGIARAFVPIELDFLFIASVTVIGVIDTFGLTALMFRGNRRGSEFTREG